MDGQAEHATVVDVLFAIDGTVLPKDHRFVLLGALARALPWLAADAAVGIHPIKAARDDDGRLLLPKRARLVMRMPESQFAAAAALTGQALDVGGWPLRVGAASVRALIPHGTLYAYFVTADTDDEQVFLQQAGARLAELGTPCKLVCGKRQDFAAGPRRVAGYSLMLHDLSREHSLLLQQVGLGRDRGLGCGIFVPHRSAAAVGSG
ncbi:MAG: type I-MYXAN CRISPR-associated protein Cas6/Cmx6 [Betaproteobacteria bacterium]|nr:type I-MYXAN CRISPR-associated protein Cas6/Cmx6 [Betaproteobacteria bacterium]